MQITVSKFQKELSHRKHAGHDVSKTYLQQERNSRIPNDNDDQSNTPVMGNTHDLGRQSRTESGECSASQPLQSPSHIHT